MLTFESDFSIHNEDYATVLYFACVMFLLKYKYWNNFVWGISVMRLICCILNFLKSNISGAAYLPEITVIRKVSSVYRKLSRKFNSKFWDLFYWGVESVFRVIFYLFCKYCTLPMLSHTETLLYASSREHWTGIYAPLFCLLIIWKMLKPYVSVKY